MIDGGRRDGKIVASSTGFPFVYLTRPVLHLVKEDVMPTISPLACLHIALAAWTFVVNSSVNKLLGVLPGRMNGRESSYIKILNFDLLDIKYGCACFKKNTVCDDGIKSLILSFFAMRKVSKSVSFADNRRVECFR